MREIKRQRGLLCECECEIVSVSVPRVSTASNFVSRKASITMKRRDWCRISKVISAHEQGVARFCICSEVEDGMGLCCDFCVCMVSVLLKRKRMCMCVCVCKREWERERERENGRRGDCV